MSIKKVFAHAAIVLSGMIIVFLLIDRVNTAMAFINNDITKALMGILCVISIIDSIIILCTKKKRKAKHL